MININILDVILKKNERKDFNIKKIQKYFNFGSFIWKYN
jgi:hypothetical protein